MQKLYKILFVSFIVMILTGCALETSPTPIKHKPVGQLVKKPYTNTEKDIEAYNQILWDGDNSIDYNSLYLKSLQEYAKKELPKKYHNKYTYRTISSFYPTTICGPTKYSRAEECCKRQGSFARFPKYYKKHPHKVGVIHCGGYFSKKTKVGLISNSKIEDKEKFSIFTNYLITQKYNLKKDKFEKTSTFQKRVQYVKNNIDSITNKYMSIAYNTIYGKPVVEAINYDADNELFYGILKSTKGNLSEKIAISVPLSIAKEFYYADKKAKVLYQYKDGKVYLKNIIVPYSGKNYMAVLNKMNYKPSNLKVALYKDIEYGEKLIAKLNNDIPKLLKQAKPHKIDKHKWLFIIGIENYEYTNPVKYSTNSAKEFKEVMKKRVGIPENNIRILINHGATSSQIDYRLRDMLRRVKKGDTIYFYYSGHGIPVPSQNNTAYMLAQDMNPAYLNDKRFQLQTIYKELSSSKASKVIAFIDSCFSGGTDNQSLIKGVAATRLKPKKVKFNTNKMVVISAGSGTQYSNKYDEKTNRLFTYYVMRGIIKNNTDLDRLYNYVKSNVQEKSYEMGASYEQVPVYHGNIKLKL